MMVVLLQGVSQDRIDVVKAIIKGVSFKDELGKVAAAVVESS